MAISRYSILPLAALALAACESEAERQADATGDRIEQQAEQSAAASGEEVAALGLTERQLLDADLVDRNGRELGDVEQVRRDPAGLVSGFLIEIEDSDPDRYVVVPLTAVSLYGSGNDADLQTSMTQQELAALPDVTMDPR